MSESVVLLVQSSASRLLEQSAPPLASQSVPQSVPLLVSLAAPPSGRQLEVQSAPLSEPLLESSWGRSWEQQSARESAHQLFRSHGGTTYRFRKVARYKPTPGLAVQKFGATLLHTAHRPDLVAKPALADISEVLVAVGEEYIGRVELVLRRVWRGLESATRAEEAGGFFSWSLCNRTHSTHRYTRQGQCSWNPAAGLLRSVRDP